VHDPNTFIDVFGLSSCKDLAHEAHQLLDKMARKFKTTAIGRNKEGQLFIASSDKTVPKVQREWAKKKGIIVVNGQGHAEETIMNSGNKVTHIDASRGVCLDCEHQMGTHDVSTDTHKTGKVSKKRR
jgi:transcription initiation factor TFIIIB Brf1 subunit/transcription initiation factor TFIIB